MLKKILAIQGVGKFLRCNASGDVELRSHKRNLFNVIVGEEGVLLVEVLSQHLVDE